MVKFALPQKHEFERKVKSIDKIVNRKWTSNELEVLAAKKFEEKIR